MLMSNMADAAAARREARRKRILENSHNRLQLISGKIDNDCHQESTIRTVIPELNYEIPVATRTNNISNSSINNGGVILEQPTFDLLSPVQAFQDMVAAGDRGVINDLAHFSTPTPAEPIPTLTFWETLSSHKYDIVFLSLFIQVLYGMSVFSFDNTHFFLPIIIYSLTKMIWFPTQNNSNVANVLLLLNGMNPGRVTKILYLSQCFNAISRDICVYLFTTICLQYLYNPMKSLFNS